MVSLLVSIGTTEKTERNPTPLKFLCLHKGQPSSLPRPQCLALLWFSQVIPLPLPYGWFSPLPSPGPLLHSPSCFQQFTSPPFLLKFKKEAILPEQDHLSFHTHAKPSSLDTSLHLLCPRCYLQSPLSCFCFLNFPSLQSFSCESLNTFSLKHVPNSTCPMSQVVSLFSFSDFYSFVCLTAVPWCTAFWHAPILTL